MKRFTIGSIALVLVVGLSWSMVSGKSPTVDGKQVITARYTDTAPIIDGQIAPGEWSAAIPVHVKFNQPLREPGVVPFASDTFHPCFPPPDNQDDLSFTVRVLYDQDSVYVSVEVADEAVIDDGPCDECPWFDDDVELFFDGDRVANDLFFPGNKEGFQLLVDPGGDQWTGPWGPGNDNPAGIEWVARVDSMTARGWAAEFRLTRASIDKLDGPLEEAMPEAGDYIGFNVVVGDDDNGGEPYNGCFSPFPLDEPAVDGFLKWTGPGDAFDESDWGLLYFEPLPPGKAKKAVAEPIAPTTWGQIKNEVK